MSEFQLRDALVSVEFSGRMADVFGGLGSGQVKADKDDLKRMRDDRPDFDQQQIERSVLFKEKERLNKYDDEEVVQFMRPRLDNSDRGGEGVLPYLTTTLALLVHNRYSSKVFLGNTFCLYTGMHCSSS